MALQPFRAPRGERVVEYVPHGQWQRLTIAAGIRLTGVCAAQAYKGGTAAEACEAFAAQSLGPGLRPGDIVIMDRLNSYSDPAVREVFRRLGVKVKLLPVVLVPGANGWPFRVTLQLYAVVVTPAGSVTTLPRVIGVPSVPTVGPTMVAVGGTSLTVTVTAMTVSLVGQAGPDQRPASRRRRDRARAGSDRFSTSSQPQRSHSNPAAHLGGPRLASLVLQP